MDFVNDTDHDVQVFDGDHPYTVKSGKTISVDVKNEALKKACRDNKDLKIAKKAKE